MDSLIITDLITALGDAGVGANTILLVVGGYFAVKYFKGNGFAKQSDIKALGKSIDRMRDESISARAELHARVDGVVKEQGEIRERVAVLDDRSRTGRCKE